MSEEGPDRETLNNLLARPKHVFRLFLSVTRHALQTVSVYTSGLFYHIQNRRLLIGCNNQAITSMCLNTGYLVPFVKQVLQNCTS
jgi:hypothetical protein